MATAEPLQNETEELRRKLRETEALLKNSEEQLSLRDRDLDEAKAKVKTAEQSLEKVDQELRTEKYEHDEAEHRSTDFERKLNTAKQLLEDGETRWEKERSDLETKVDELEGEIRELRDGRRQFERDCEKKVTELNRDMEFQDGNLEESRKEVEVLGQKYQSLSDQNTELEKIVQDQKRDYDMACQLVERTQADLLERNKQIADLQRTNDEAQSNKDACQQLMQERAQLNKEIGRLFTQIEEQEERDNVTGQNLDDTRAQLFEAQAESRELKVRYDAVEDKLDQALARNAWLEAESRGRTNGPGSPRGKGLLSSASPPPAYIAARPPLETQRSTLEEELSADMESDESEEEFEQVIFERTKTIMIVADIEPRAQVVAKKNPSKLSKSDLTNYISVDPRAAQKPSPPALSSPKISRVVTAPKAAVPAPLTPVKVSADNAITITPSPLILNHQRSLAAPAAPPKETRVIHVSPLTQLSHLPSLDDPLSLHIWRAICITWFLTTYYNVSQALFYAAFNSSSQSSLFVQGLYSASQLMGYFPGLALIRFFWGLIWGFIVQDQTGSYRGEVLEKTAWEIKGLFLNFSGMKHQAIY